MTSFRVFKFSILLLVAGCSVLRPTPEVVMRVDTVTVVREVPPALPPGDTTEICLSTGVPAQVLVTATGDTLVNGVSVKQVRPILTFAGAYLEQRTDTVRFERRLYRRAGLLERRSCDELKLVGAQNGIPVFAEVTAPSPLQMILLPVRPGAFQRYTTPVARQRR